MELTYSFLLVTSTSTWARPCYPEDGGSTFLWSFRASLYCLVWNPKKWPSFES
jgi:hypothetical protein